MNAYLPDYILVFDIPKSSNTCTKVLFKERLASSKTLAEKTLGALTKDNVHMTSRASGRENK